MQIILDVNEEELNQLNNAIIAYSDILFAAELGASLPKKFEKLNTLSFEQIQERKEMLLSIHKKIFDF